MENRSESRRRLKMKSNANNTSKWKKVATIGALTLIALATMVLKLRTNSLAFAHAAQTTFQSPAQAGAALAAAAKNLDEAGLEKLLGGETLASLKTGDKESDKASAAPAW